MHPIEFEEWRLFFELEPPESIRHDMRAAMLAAVYANSKRDPRKRPKAFELTDFVVRFGDDIPTPTRKQTWQEQKAAFMALVGAYKAAPKTTRPEPTRRPRTR